jgi:Monooxygenase af470-like
MAAKVNRVTVDLSSHPNLVVIYLGMQAHSLRGWKTVFQFGPRIKGAVEQKPDGLLLHENFLFSLFPLHVGMRQYWRDFESLETWARSIPHQDWWHRFLRDSAGTGFWHETYFMGGGMEAIYDDLVQPVGLLRFAPQSPAHGPMFSARKRAGIAGEPALKPAIPEQDL